VVIKRRELIYDEDDREVDVNEKKLDELLKATKALLLAQLQAQLPADEWEKPEVVLARAGFVAREIAELLGKSHAAVTKAIQRGRAA
jgi:DNA-directed RNA polymerase specialized sigma24 family protein